MRTESGSTSGRADYLYQEVRVSSSPSPSSSQWPAVRTLRCHNVVLVLLSASLLVFAGCEGKEAPPQMGPPEVEVADVVQQSVPIFQEWVAQLNGPTNAEITPKVQGYLLSQNYENGYFVKKGQLMYTIDPRPFQAALEQGQAEVSVAQANLERTQADVDRDTPLAAQNAIPKKQLDNDIANLASWKAQLKARQAQLEQAELNLGWTKVYSPIDGIAGASTSQIGDLVGTSTKMTTVSQVDPIWAYFNVSESAFLGVAPQVNRIISGRATFKSEALPPVDFIQANGEPYPARGKFIYVNRQVGTQTGTIQMAAQFPNKGATLRPGGFGRVRIQTDINKNALLVPQAAVVQVQSLYQVVVVTPDNKASFRPVKVGERVGMNWIISEGLKPGEKVIVEGLMKVREGVPVSPKPYVPAPAAASGN
jgi:membrane fusion protein, multidrug efflux system